MSKSKFALFTKKGQVVHLIRINICTGSQPSYVLKSEKDGLSIMDMKIIHQTRIKIALNDDWITILDRLLCEGKKNDYSHYLGDISISIKVNDSLFANGIFSTCYTIENPEKIIKKMKRKIMLKIDKEYGFLRDINISKVLEDMEINYLSSD